MKRGEVKRKNNYYVIGFSLLFIVALIFVGLVTGLFGNITGFLTKSLGVNITVGIPAIITVHNYTLVSNTLTAGPYYTTFIINFSVYDAAGTTVLNDSTSKINITMSGEVMRQNTTCTRYQTSSNYANYTCNITMWWYDGAGAWNITASIIDNVSNFAKNDSTVFTIGSTTGFELSPTNLTWNAFAAGSTNQTSSNDPLTLNNTGNQPIGTGLLSSTSNITINATDVKGEGNSAYALFANNFSGGTTTGGTCSGAACTECGGGLQGNFSKGNFANFSGASLNKGNYTDNSGTTGAKQLYFCLRLAGNELTTQAYSTVNQGAWTIKIG